MTLGQKGSIYVQCALRTKVIQLVIYNSIVLQNENIPLIVHIIVETTDLTRHLIG